MLSCCFPRDVSPQSVILNSIDNKNTPLECFGWIEKNMNPGSITTDTTIENHTYPIVDIPAKNLCEYKTTHGKTKHLNAHRLFYTDAQNTRIDSGICRASLHLNPKHFFSWLLDKGTTEQRTQYIFNLVQRGYGEYGRPIVRPGCYYSDNTYKGKHGTVNVKDSADFLYGGNPFFVHSIHVSKTASSSKDILLMHHFDWKDGGIISIPDLDRLASEVFKAMQNGASPVIHCVSGHGRTGVLTAAAILKVEIQGQNKIEVNRNNYKAVVCKLVKDLRNEGGRPPFCE